jgi:hypothetical protein
MEKSAWCSTCITLFKVVHTLCGSWEYDHMMLGAQSEFESSPWLYSHGPQNKSTTLIIVLWDQVNVSRSTEYQEEVVLMQK